MPKKGIETVAILLSIYSRSQNTESMLWDKRNMFDNFQLFWTFQSYFFKFNMYDL